MRLLVFLLQECFAAQLCSNELEVLLCSLLLQLKFTPLEDKIDTAHMVTDLFQGRTVQKDQHLPKAALLLVASLVSRKLSMSGLFCP